MWAIDIKIENARLRTATPVNATSRDVPVIASSKNVVLLLTYVETRGGTLT
jgi:hypothetical protein